MGEPEFSKGVWCGVVLDQPTGKNNGSVHGIRYFTCEPNYGMFVPVSKVELDTSSRRLRNHSNSQTTSRSSSVERTGVERTGVGNGSSSTYKSTNQPYTQQKGSSSSSNPLVPSSKMGLSIQQDLVNRLSQPLKRPSQKQQQLQQNQKTGGAGGRRQPMKAFATKGAEEISVKESRKPMMPFRAGGMYKASSSDNLRCMKDKEKVGSGGLNKANQGMPAKKSSSERDLRNSKKSSGVSSMTSTSSSSTAKSKRKQNRINSCSDLLTAGPSVAPSNSKTDFTEESSTRRLSCDSQLTYLNGYSWPRTSTPGNRDELTPDGCSSPEETDDNISKTKTTPLSHGPHNNGFVEAPSVHSPPTVNGGESRTEGKGEGLATHTKQFFESEVSSPSLPHPSVQAPEVDFSHNKQYYKNRPSGTATLLHPLTSSLITDGAHLLKQLIGSNKSVRTCTICLLLPFLIHSHILPCYFSPPSYSLLLLSPLCVCFFPA